MAIEGKGRWITIAGQHIYIEEGETPMAAYIKHMAGKGKKGSKKVSKAKERDERHEKEFFSSVKENKFRISDPYTLYGEKNDSGEIPTKEYLMKHMNRKIAATGDEDLEKNAEKYVDEYLKYRIELEKKRRK